VALGKQSTDNFFAWAGVIFAKQAEFYNSATAHLNLDEIIAKFGKVARSVR